MNNLHGALVFATGGGLSGLWENLLQNWVGPIVIALVAIFAIKFIIDGAWMKLFSFVGIAIVVGLLVFGGSMLFGPDGAFTQSAKEVVQDLN